MAALKGTHMSLNCPSLGGTDRETNRKTKQNKTQNLEKDAGYFKLMLSLGGEDCSCPSQLHIVGCLALGRSKTDTIKEGVPEDR